ncbi:alpha/beta fold hydrolase [Micromonospora wenchangensis]|uniref:alpha/beta fold hydrolase n=1 Tax=Micromonospora wenchangensis TaxID=1185415 RepID=UPI003D75E0E2
MSTYRTVGDEGLMAGTERHVPANGVQLCVDTFGTPGHPAVLLVSGASNSMDWWADGLCRRLADGGRYVVRYDHRDTGRSTGWPAGSPDYHFDDLVADAAALIDRLDLGAAHVWGISMGGAIAQRLAVEHPHRVASLTLSSTSPALRIGKRPYPDLPPMSQALMASFGESRPDPDWDDPDSIVEHIAAGQRPLTGSVPLAGAELRELVARAVARTVDIRASLANHWSIDGGAEYRDALPGITVPALVVHGTEDPLFPYGHGEALAAELPVARLLPLQGVGHQMPPRATWDMLVMEVLSHTGGGAGKPTG